MDNALSTSLYTKPTDRNTLLHAASFHPTSLKRNLPLSQLVCQKDGVVKRGVKASSISEITNIKSATNPLQVNFKRGTCINRQFRSHHFIDGKGNPY